jgi:hypothetical protein
MSLETTRRELTRILPEDHPFFERFDQLMVPAEPKPPEEKGEHDGSQDYLHLLEDVIHVVQTIEDWKRGIRDWSEVEAALERVKKETT